MFRNRAVSLALVGLCVWLTGCTSWQQIEIAELPDYSVVKVTTTDRDEHQFRDPELVSDTLRGRVMEDARIGGYRWSDSVTAIPLGSVQNIESRETDYGQTTLAVLAGAAFVGVMIIVLRGGR